VNAELMDLSTVRQPVAEQAVDITTRLLSIIAAPDGLGTDEVVLPTELVVRGSTDPSRSVA
jgi:DNA-binding LacI/PurR family transcriptional regulator